MREGEFGASDQRHGGCGVVRGGGVGGGQRGRTGARVECVVVAPRSLFTGPRPAGALPDLQRPLPGSLQGQ